MPLPELLEYNQAIQDPRICFRDPELRGGRPRVDAFDQPQPCTGNFAAVYEMRQPAAKDAWAVKCFIREVGGLKDRYRAISEHLSRVKRSGFRFAVDFQFLDDGILVNGKWHPVLKMRWVEGTNLNQFVKDNAQRPALLSALATLWLRMARDLRSAKMAHGDLQHGNVLLVSGQNANTVHLRLIDYDGMFVPALAGTKSNEIGHRNYQHPQRVDDPYHGEIDRFSHLAIWTALHCVMSTGRTLWDRYDSGENLLFREEDFQSPGSSQLFQEAWKINEPTAHALVGRLVLASLGSARAVPLLHEIAPNGQPMALTADEERQVVKLLTAGAKKGVRPPPRAAVVSRTHVARKPAPAPAAGGRAGVKASARSGRSASPVVFQPAQAASPAPAAQAAWPATAPPGQVHWKKRRRKRISLPLVSALVATVAVLSLLVFIGARAARSLIATIVSSPANTPPPVVPGQPVSQPSPVAPQAPSNHAGADSPVRLSHGRRVSVSVHVNSHFHVQNQATSRLKEALGACLMRSGIQVVEGQTTVFRLTLSERVGVTKPRYIIDSRGRRTVMSTSVVASLHIELVTADRPEPIWRVDLAAGTSETNGTPNNTVIDRLVPLLSTLAIPNDILALALNENLNLSSTNDQRTVPNRAGTKPATGGIPGAPPDKNGTAVASSEPPVRATGEPKRGETVGDRGDAPAADPDSISASDWGGGELRIPVADHVDVTFGVHGCPLVVVGAEVWSLESGASLQTLQGSPARNSARALSNNGRWFAATKQITDRTDVMVWSTGTGERVLEVTGDPKSYIGLVRFAGDDELWLARRQDNTIEVWDLAEGKLARTIKMPQRWSVDSGKFTIIPDGRFFACVHDQQVVAYSASDGRLAATMAAPGAFESKEARTAARGPRANAKKNRIDSKLDAIFFNAWIQCLAFSPDGNELAAVSTHPTPQIVCWNNRGKVVYQEPLPFSLHSAHDSLDWLPDASGWLINGKLFDRESKQVLLSIKMGFTDESALHFLDRDRLLGRPNDRAAQLQVLTIPWESLRASLEQMNSGAPALLSPGRPVSVSVKIDSPQVDQNQTAGQLTEALKECLLRAGIEVVEGQTTVFRVTLSEKAESLPVSQRRSPIGFPGQQPGQATTEFTESLMIELVAADNLEPSWHRLLSTVPYRSSGNAFNDQKTRQGMIAQLVNQLTALEIPYYIPESHEHPALPLIIE